jgi:hypothetical protein
MKALSRTRRWRLAVLGASAGMVLAVAQKGQASGGAFTYQVLAPGTGYALVAGSTIPITWTSTGSGNVNISLVDVAAWAVVDVVASNTADYGIELYPIPATMPAGQYLIYIGDVGRHGLDVRRHVQHPGLRVAALAAVGAARAPGPRPAHAAASARPRRSPRGPQDALNDAAPSRTNPGRGAFQDADCPTGGAGWRTGEVQAGGESPAEAE